MRVLLAVLLNLVLVTALTIASVHIQLSPLLNRLEWAKWVHMALMLVCLAQFTMAAVWAATARGRRLAVWAHGMLLVMACTVPLFIALNGILSLHSNSNARSAVVPSSCSSPYCKSDIRYSSPRLKMCQHLCPPRSCPTRRNSPICSRS